MIAALEVEWLKLRRSPLVWIVTAVISIGIPALCVAFMASARYGDPTTPTAIKIKAMVPSTDFAGLIAITGQVLSVGSLVAVGIVVAWSFGREFTDRTVASLFSLSVGRGTIAAAKLVVLLAWGAVITVVAVFVATIGGLLLRLGAPRAAELGIKAVTVGLLAVLLALPLGFVASSARGYLPAIGALILLVVATQVITTIGGGAWFPYASPSLRSGMGGAARSSVGFIQLALVPMLAAGSVAATLNWWRRAQIV